MKIVFYKQLLADHTTSMWTPSQQIVYSYLLSQSILDIKDLYDAEGKHVDLENLFNSFCNDGYIDLYKYNVNKMSALLNLSKQNIYDCLEFLSINEVIRNCLIFCPQKIVSLGYFELKVESKLSKQLLIFYSWLCERGKQYNSTIDTYSYRLGELYHTSDTNIRVMLHRLSQKGYIERNSKNGKLFIKK